MRRHLSYANVVSTLCLILLLGGGTAMASVIITKNSQVDRATISGHHPPKGDHPNIIRGSLSGADLSQQLKGSLRLHCPSDMRQAAGLCFEDSLRPAAFFEDALATCAAANRRLPTLAELALVFNNSGAPQTYQWSDTHFFDNDDSGNHSVGTDLRENSSRTLFVGAQSGDKDAYRCVTSPTN